MDKAWLDPLLAPSKDAWSDTPLGPSKEEVRHDPPLDPSEEEPPLAPSKDSAWSDPLLAPSNEACSVEDSVSIFSVASSTPGILMALGLNGNTPHVRNPAMMLAGEMAFAHACEKRALN